MNDPKAKAVNGENNKRLYSEDPIKNEGTAAWTNTLRTTEDANVPIPDEDSVVEAREWVNDGSKL